MSAQSAGIGTPLSPGAAAPGAAIALGPITPADRTRAAHPALLTNVQVLRGLAALSVVLFHAQEFVATRRGPTGLAVFDPRFGLMGVALFFAISGYLMARLVRASDPATFLAHRVLRILPPFLVLAAGMRLLSPLLGINVPFHLLALTLVPVGPVVYPLGGEWTLVCETTFYLVMFLIGVAALTHRIEALAVAWLALLVAAWAVRAPISPDPTLEPVYSILLTSPCAAFAGGLLLPRLVERGLFPAALALVAVPLAIASGAFATDANRWTGGLAAVIIVGCAVQAGQIPVRNWAARLLVRLGDWSYVLYLIHLSVILTVLAWAPANWPPVLVWVVAVAVSLAAAALVGPLDVGGYRRLKRWVDRSTASRRWLICGIYLAVFATAAVYGGVFTALADYRTGRVDRILAKLPPGALSSHQAVAAAIRAAGLDAPATLKGAAEELIPVPPHQVYLKAWAVDEARPGEPLVLSAYCGGIRVAAGLPGRRRVDVPSTLGRDALRKRQIGYLLGIRTTDCPDLSGLVALVSDLAGRTLVLPVSPGGTPPR